MAIPVLKDLSLNLSADLFIQLFQILQGLLQDFQSWCTISLYSEVNAPFHWVGHCVATELNSRVLQDEVLESISQRVVLVADHKGAVAIRMTGASHPRQFVLS